MGKPKTTLGEAQESVDFPIKLPSYPPDLGAPQAIYIQDEFGPIVIAVWSETHNPEQVKMSLHLLGTDAALAKSQPQVIRRAQVSGIPAVWTQGPYMVIVTSGEAEFRRLVEGHVLIWKEGEITYRLATLDDANGIAQVHVAAWETTYRGIVEDEMLGHRTVERREARWRKNLSSTEPGRPVLVALEGDRIVGWDPTLPLYQVRTLDDLYERSLARTSFMLVKLAWRSSSVSSGSTA